VIVLCTIDGDTEIGRKTKSLIKVFFSQDPVKMLQFFGITAILLSVCIYGEQSGYFIADRFNFYYLLSNFECSQEFLIGSCMSMSRSLGGYVIPAIFL